MGSDQRLTAGSYFQAGQGTGGDAGSDLMRSAGSRTVITAQRRGGRALGIAPSPAAVSAHRPCQVPGVHPGQPGPKNRGCSACRDATRAVGTRLPRLLRPWRGEGLCSSGSGSVTSREISLGSHTPAVPNYPPSISSWLFVVGPWVLWQLERFAGL